jgi:hypothetical protein
MSSRLLGFAGGSTAIRLCDANALRDKSACFEYEVDNEGSVRSKYELASSVYALRDGLGERKLAEGL